MKSTSIEALIEVLDLFNKKLGVIPRSEFEEKKKAILDSLQPEPEQNALHVIADMEDSTQPEQEKEGVKAEDKLEEKTQAPVDTSSSTPLMPSIEEARINTPGDKR